MAFPFQPSFSRGVVAPGLRDRVDLALYQTALAECRNFVPLRLGGVQSRPGMPMVSPASVESATARLIRFVYSRTQAYLLEFCAGRAWVYKDGARLTFGDPAAALVDITTATENGVVAVAIATTYFQIQTYIPHGWSTGDVVQVSGVTGTGEIDHANGVHAITVTGISTFRVARLTSGAATWTSTAGGRVSRCVSVATPYTQDELAGLRVTQSADVMTVFSRTHPPHELRRTSATVFTFAEREYDTGPFQPDNSDEAVLMHASATRGTVTLTATGDVFEADHVGSLVRLEAESLSEEQWDATKPVSVGDRRRYGVNVYLCTAASGVNTGTRPPEHTKGREKDGESNAWKEWEYQHSGYGVARITAVATARSATATVISRFPDAVVGGAVTVQGPWTMTGDGSDVTLSVAAATSDLSSDYELTFDGVIQPYDDYSVTGSTTDVMTFATAPASGVSVSARQLSSNKRTSLWALGAWSEVQGYPGVGAYYGDRLTFGSTTAEPQRLDLTETGNYDSFKPSVPALDADPIDVQLGGREMSAITDLVPATTLAILTEGGAYRLASGDQDTVTPGNVAPKKIDNIPAADSPAALADKAAVYIARGRRRIHDLILEEGAPAAGEELSLAASHLLTKAAVAEGLDYQFLPESIVWTVRSDGRLLSLTYLKDQEVLGWGWHETTGTIEQVCVVPEDDEDVVYLLVKRTLAGTVRRFIERLADREPGDNRDIVCVDNALTFDGRLTGATAYLSEATMTAWRYAAVITGYTLTDADIGRELWLTGVDEEDEPRTIRLRIHARTGTTVALGDCDSTPPSTMLDVTLSDLAIATDTLTGATHLAGVAVAVQIDGGVHDTVTVASDGTIALENHTAVAHAGLAYTCNIETLAINILGRETVRTKQKAVNKVTALVIESNGLEAGQDADHLEAFPGRDVTDEYELPANYTGAAAVDIESTWNDTGKVQLWQRNPLPATIVGVIPDVKVGR